jgi:hypothetical protein
MYLNLYKRAQQNGKQYIMGVTKFRNLEKLFQCHFGWPPSRANAHNGMKLNSLLSGNGDVFICDTFSKIKLGALSTINLCFPAPKGNCMYLSILKYTPSQ